MNKPRISTTKIAEICGVSQGTVDRALNGRKGIRPETKEKILSVAKEYGYRPNIHARSIAGGKSQLIGVVVFNLNNQYFSDFLTCVEKYCTAQNYSTVVMFTNKDSTKEINCINNLYHMAVDGIILCPVNNGEEYENYLLSLNIPIVTIGNKLNRIPYIGINNSLAMKETVEYVIQNGYQKLIYVKPKLLEKNTFAQKERLTAFTAVCHNAKVKYTITDLHHAEKELQEDTACALICPTDIYAIKLLSAAKRHNAGIVGFDNIRLIDELDLKLDSVSYDVESTVKTAIDYILNGNLIQTPILHQLVKRGSV